MTLADIVTEMRKVAREFPHICNPDLPFVPANEKCLRDVEIEGRVVLNVMFTYADHGAVGRTWNLSLSDQSGKLMPERLVATVVKAFFGREADVREVDARLYPPEMRAQMPPGYRQFFTKELQ